MRHAIVPLNRGGPRRTDCLLTVIDPVNVGIRLAVERRKLSQHAAVPDPGAMICTEDHVRGARNADHLPSVVDRLAPALNRARQQNTYLESLITQYRALDRGTKSGEGGPVGLAAIDKELDEKLHTAIKDFKGFYKP